MNKFFTLKRCASAIGLLAVTAISNDVLASGYAARELSVYAQGSAYSGASSSTDSISYMYFNPAMLVHQMGTQMESGAFTIFPHSTATNTQASLPFDVPIVGPQLIPIPGETEVENFGKYALTGNGYFLFDYCNDLKFGVAVTAPWGLKDDYGGEHDWAGRFQALHSSMESININPMVSWRFNEQWSFGVGFQAQYLAAELTNKFGIPQPIFALVPVLGPALLDEPGVEPFARIQGYGWGFGFNLGAMFQPWEDTTIGVGYRSQVAHELGHQKSEFLQPFANELPFIEEVAGPFPAPLVALLDTLIIPLPYKFEATAKVRTPQQVNAGITHHVNDRWTVMADVQWTDWTVLNELRVKFEDVPLPDQVLKLDWESGWWGSIGTSYEANCHWIFRGGAAYDRSPSRDEELRTPRVPDSDRIWLSVGATYHINYHFSIDASYSHVFVKDAEIHTPLTTPQGAAAGTLNVDYVDGYVDILGLDIIYRF